MKRARILLADDHKGVGEALQSLLSSEFELVGLVEDGLRLIEAATALNPDVVIADLSMPRLDGLGAMARLREKNPAIKFILMTMHQDATLAQVALENGASGFVVKYLASDELFPAIHAVLEGDTYVSPVLGSKSAITGL